VSKIIAQFNNNEDNVTVTLAYGDVWGTARLTRNQFNSDGSDNINEDETGPLVEMTMKFAVKVANESLLAGGVSPDGVILSLMGCKSKKNVTL
jgi:hypothetical protein